MKNKIVALLICLSTLFSITFNASEINQEQLPKWISVKYSDVYNQSVSEYQLVTVTVQNYGLWFTNNDYEVSADFDPAQLELVNTVITNSYGDKTSELSQAVNFTENNFEVSYQFYLQPDVDLTTVPVTISKVKNSEIDKEETIELKATSNSMMNNYQIGNITLGYAVDKYTNDGTNIEYNGHFKVIANPDNQDFALSLKKNTMNVADDVDYQINVTSDKGTVAKVDNTNYQLKMRVGQEFDLNIKTPVSGLSAKDDRFDFLLYVQSGDQYIRISPKFYRSELTESQTDTRFRRYVVIKAVIIGFFVLLTILFAVANRKRKKEPKSTEAKEPKSKEAKHKEPKNKQSKKKNKKSKSKQATELNSDLDKKAAEIKAAVDQIKPIEPPKAEVPKAEAPIESPKVAATPEKENNK